MTTKGKVRAAFEVYNALIQDMKHGRDAWLEYVPSTGKHVIVCSGGDEYCTYAMPVSDATAKHLIREEQVTYLHL